MTEETKAPETMLVSVGGVQFQIAQSDEPARFVFDLQRGGSPLLNRIIAFIAKRKQLNCVSLSGTVYVGGPKAADFSAEDLEVLIRPGNLYSDFRSFPKALLGVPAFREGRSLMMFRDPRDALVARYYADPFLRGRPKADAESPAPAMEIDEFVLKKADTIKAAYLAHAEVMALPQTLALRYEDFIFARKRLVMKILQHFGLTLHRDLVEVLVGQVEKIGLPDAAADTPGLVLPGDHRRKLARETIAKLDRRLESALKLYDYY